MRLASNRSLSPLILFFQFITPMGVGFNTIVYLSINLIAYSLAIYFAYSTAKELKIQASTLSRRTYSLQKQFGLTLLIQSLIPLIILIVPGLLALIFQYFQIENDLIGELVILAMICHPFLNSLSNLIFIKPYRKYCLRPFKVVCKRFCEKSSINVIPVSSNFTSWWWIKVLEFSDTFNFRYRLELFNLINMN